MSGVFQIAPELDFGKEVSILANNVVVVLGSILDLISVCLSNAADCNINAKRAPLKH